MNDEEDLKQMLFLVNGQLKEEFNIKCIQNKTSMGKVLRDFMIQYIED